MSILLTGGSGFIGSHFHRFIPNQDIVNLDIQKPFFENESTHIQGDIRNKEDVERALQGKNIDCIISLAAKHHDFGIGYDEYFDTNEEGTKIICEVAAEFGIKKIIFYSSVAVYGLTQQVSNEELSPHPDSPYGASKLAGEKVLQAWAEEDSSREVIIIRPTVVFGRDNVANMYNLINQIDSGFYFHLGKASNIKSIAYVENLVKATLFLKQKMKPGVAIYNYADEPQLNSRVIGNTIAGALGKRIRFNVPTWLGRAVGLPFDLIIKITGKNLPVSSARIRKLGTQTYHSARKVFDEGFVPDFTTIEGLEKMVSWYKSVNKLTQ
jgi:nucleoside-diphosphate-sugar epimerase